ncbi:MAG: ATP synthase subunit I, partial [Pseudohongiellaceae bacterium]
QFVTSVLAASGAFLLLDMVAAYSVLLGGLICTLPNGYFARKAFQYRGARSTALIVRSFYAGEAGKLVMTAVMFALVFAAVRPLNELAVIVSFIITIIIGLIATAYVNNKSTKQLR